MDYIKSSLKDTQSSSLPSSVGSALRPTPLVTVICPIFNDADLVSQAIDSVLMQTMRDFKFIVFDNGSTDDTRQVISNYTDDRITVIKSHLNLKSEIMASLLLEANTPYIAQIYSDDTWEPRKLALSIDEILRTGCDAVFSNNVFIGDQGQILEDHEVPSSQFVGDITSMTIDEHLHRFIFRGNTLHPVSMVIKTDAYRRLGGVKPYLHSVGDMEFFVRLMLNGKICFLEDKLQKIRIKSSGRQNESMPGRASYLRIIGERMRFYDLLTTPQFMSRMETVFFPELKKVKINPALKKWFLGHQLMKLGDPDCNLIGMQTIYNALDENIEEIEGHVIAMHGKSIGQYMEEMASRCFSSAVDDRSAQEIYRLNTIIADQQLALKAYQQSDDHQTANKLAEREALNLNLKRELEVKTQAEQANYINQLRSEIEELRSSTSWYVTAPLRGLAVALRGPKKSLPNHPTTPHAPR